MLLGFSLLLLCHVFLFDLILTLFHGLVKRGTVRDGRATTVHVYNRLECLDPRVAVDPRRRVQLQLLLREGQGEAQVPLAALALAVGELSKDRPTALVASLFHPRFDVIVI